MDWDNSFRAFFSPPQTSFNFLYNYARHAETIMEKISYGGEQEKKKRMSSEQIESLERSFQEEIKLEPDRKMKLSRELGLQPRQIAVWFQNRRARWKAKQIELLYDALKLEFDVVSKEKQKLQEQVTKLQSMVREQAIRKQVKAVYTEISGEETVESTAVGLHSSTTTRGMMMASSHQTGECSFFRSSVDDYNPASTPYWAVVPSNYP